MVPIFQVPIVRAAMELLDARIIKEGIINSQCSISGPVHIKDQEEERNNDRGFTESHVRQSG